MSQQHIFDDKVYKNKLADFKIDTVEDIEEKKRLIEKYINEEIKTGHIEARTEESYQSDFLNLFFGDILGYIYKDAKLWNLEKEYKSVTDGTKADGALGFFEMDDNRHIIADVRVVIELKNALSDLDRVQHRQNDRRTPVEQAFSYNINKRF